MCDSYQATLQEYPAEEVQPLTISSNVHWGQLKLPKLYLPYTFQPKSGTDKKGEPPGKGSTKAPRSKIRSTILDVGPET